MRKLALPLALLLSGCGNLGYYAQLARGQVQLLSSREPIAGILADPARDAALRARLSKVQDARRWASATLALPDNGSYTDYADIQRDYVVWNVFATPELSLEPVQHCFLIAGCLAYRGYFDQTQARAKSAELAAQGYDVHVGGVPAYSSLGWFDDPVINTMMRWDDETLLGTLFHELAHQQVFVQGDTAFNESYASFVEQEGLRQYLAPSGGGSAAHAERKQRQEQFTRLMLGAREQLATLYRLRLEPEALRARKQEAFAQLRLNYARLRDDSWGGWTGYDAFMAEGLNNAKLLPFGLYDEYVPAFAALFEQSGRQWAAFHVAVKTLGELEPGARVQKLDGLKARQLPE